MKILFITDQFPPQLDGIGDYTFYIGKAFVEDGHEVHVLCRQGEPGKNHYITAGIKVHAHQKGWTLSLLGELFSKVKEIRPDRISLQYNPYGFSHLGMPFHLLIFVLGLRLMGYPIQTTFHEIAIRLDSWNPKVWITGIVQRIISNVVHLLSTHSFTSISLYRRYIYVAKQKLSLLPIGCTIDDGRIADWQFNNELVLTYFGRNPRGIFDVPRLLEQLKLQGLSCKFLFIGKFSEDVRQKIKSDAESRGLTDAVAFTGFLSAPEAMDALRNASLYVGLMEDTGMTLKSTSLAAAFCAGLPVVGTKGDMTDDYFFQNGINCVLVANDPSEMASSIKSLIQDQWQMKKLAKASRDSYDQHLSWSALYRQYIRVLQ